jgi:transcriptional regulator with XRE-family HTH domain
MPEEPEANAPQRDGHEAEKDQEIAQLWQQVLREELRHRKNFRETFEHHEKILGQKVRQLRTERGWTQEQLAEKLNGLGWTMHQTTVAKLEAGARPIRIAEADALALAFGLPIEAMWYLPVAGEPWSMAAMRGRLKNIDEFIDVLEDQLRSTMLMYADQQSERMRLTQVMNEVAKTASRGELKDLNLSPEDSRGFVEAMRDHDRDDADIPMPPGPRAALRHEHLASLEGGEPERLAAEAWRRHLAGESPGDIAAFLARAMPLGTEEPLRVASEIVRETLGTGNRWDGPQGY